MIDQAWMRCSGLRNLALLAVVAIACRVSPAFADEIDDILLEERIAYEAAKAEMAAPEPAVKESKGVVTPAQRDTGSADVRARLAAAESELARARAEIAVLNKALADSEERHRRELRFSYYNMGCVYKASKQYERAEAEFLKALEIDPEDAAVHYNLGILYEDDLNRKRDAQRHYEKFLELSPADRDAALVQEWLSTMD